MPNKQKVKQQLLARRTHRTRTRIRGTASQPRLSVFRSLKHISAQVIDDSRNMTVCAADDRSIKGKATPMERAKQVGEAIGKLAKAKNITAVVFDRGGRRYHGRIKALAEGARSAGLEF